MIYKKETHCDFSVSDLSIPITAFEFFLNVWSYEFKTSFAYDFLCTLYIHVAVHCTCTREYKEHGFIYFSDNEKIYIYYPLPMSEACVWGVLCNKYSVV